MNVSAHHYDLANRYGEPPVDFRSLRHQGNPVPTVPGRIAVDKDLPTLHLLESDNEFDKSRFARSIRTHEGDTLA